MRDPTSREVHVATFGHSDLSSNPIGPVTLQTTSDTGVDMPGVVDAIVASVCILPLTHISHSPTFRTHPHLVLTIALAAIATAALRHSHTADLCLLH